MIEGFRYTSGDRLGRLTVIAYAGNGRYQCRCDCGIEVTVFTSNLSTAHTQSCGCLASELKSARNFVHGKTDTREYRIWTNMKTRCLNSKNEAFPQYGGRGIKICHEWVNDFGAFLRDMGPCPKGMTLERLENNNGYDPGNCAWRSYQDQQNNRRDNVLIQWQGRTQTASQWSRETGVPAKSIRYRLRVGMALELVLGPRTLRPGRTR